MGDNMMLLFKEEVAQYKGDTSAKKQIRKLMIKVNKKKTKDRLLVFFACKNLSAQVGICIKEGA